MAEVDITVRTGTARYNIELSHPETNGQVWGRDKKHLDALVDAAVAQIKRAYTAEAERNTTNE